MRYTGVTVQYKQAHLIPDRDQRSGENSTLSRTLNPSSGLVDDFPLTGQTGGMATCINH